MIWQDIVIGTGQVLFSVALLPAIFGPDKPPRSTCLMTAAILVAFTVSFATLGLAWSAGTAFACAWAWTILLLQRRPNEGAYSDFDRE